ncbi:stalk domain-containing protein [Anaerotignum sp.]
MKKEMKRLLSLACAMVLAFPVIGYAADAEVTQKMPVSVEADCTVTNNSDKELLIENIVIKEVVPDAFSEGNTYSFYVKNMEFTYVDMMKSSGDLIFDSDILQEGELVFTVKEANDQEIETISLSGVLMTAKYVLPVGTYYLYMTSSNMENEKIPVVFDFIKVENQVDFTKKKLDISIGMSEETLQVNGEKKALRVPAYISDRGYTMLPIREVTEVFPGVKVLWDNEKKEATILYGYDYVSIIAGANVMHINGKENILKNVAEVKDGRMFISLRDVCRICSVPTEDVHWDAQTKTVSINTYVY